MHTYKYYPETLINESSAAWYCFKLVWTFETPKKCNLRTLERLSRSLQATHVGLQLPPELLDMQGVSPTYLKEGGCEPCQNLNQPNGSLNLKSG